MKNAQALSKNSWAQLAKAVRPAPKRRKESCGNTTDYTAPHYSDKKK